MHESSSQKSEIQRWSRLAIQLNGAIDTGRYEHLTTDVIVRVVRDGAVFDLLYRELPAEVWRISKLTDVDRHKLSEHWKRMADGYDPSQFHVRHNGLALLVAYVLHLIDVLHATIPA
jgi:hypothetical protein